MRVPRLIVEVRWGKLAGTKVVMSAGHTVRVGRLAGADVVVEHDGQMSRVHFELGWDGSRAISRDLGSLAGTMLGGKRVEGEVVVEHGDWIQAGETDFMVYVEAKTLPREEVADEEEVKRREAAEKALVELREVAGREKLYAVLDAARDDRILDLLREHVEPHRSLYDGLEGETMEEVAPYLVGPMRGDSGLLDRLVLEGWGKRWGIWCTSEERFVEVRRHWRRFLMVELEETGERVYFRFYDPGVMRVFWGACEEWQQESLFGTTNDWLFERVDNDIIQLKSDESRSASSAPIRIIGKRQYRALILYVRESFCAMMAAHIREHYVDWLDVQSDEERLAWVRLALDHCERYDIITEPEAAQLILFYMWIGCNITEEPWAAQIFENDGLQPIGKLRKFLEFAEERGLIGFRYVVFHNELGGENLYG